jgi:bacillithiol biosynthesis deacetylase BshB1
VTRPAAGAGAGPGAGAGTGTGAGATAAAPRRILAVGAHPDDVEFGCGGILAKEAARGHAVVILNLTRGESATHGTSAERAAEAAAAAERLGAALEFLALAGDARLEHKPDNAIAIASVIRRLRPHLVLAPSPEENQHPDHGRAGRLVRDAARLARYGGLRGLEPHAPHAIDALFFYDITGTGAAPAGLARLLVDVSEVFDAWKAAMECHRSQMATRDYVGLQIARARVAGAEIGAAYAMAVWANDAIRLQGLTDLPGTGRRF